MFRGVKYRANVRRKWKNNLCAGTQGFPATRNNTNPTTNRDVYFTPRNIPRTLQTLLKTYRIINKSYLKVSKVYDGILAPAHVVISPKYAIIFKLPEYLPAFYYEDT